jgi:hypothetical protein
MLRWPFGARQRPTGGCRKPTVPCGKLKLSTFAEFWFPHATVAFWDPPKGDSGGPERPPYQAETQSSPPRSQRPWRRRRPVDTSYAEKNTENNSKIPAKPGYQSWEIFWSVFALFVRVRCVIFRPSTGCSLSPRFASFRSVRPFPLSFVKER